MTAIVKLNDVKNDDEMLWNRGSGNPKKMCTEIQTNTLWHLVCRSGGRKHTKSSLLIIHMVHSYLHFRLNL